MLQARLRKALLATVLQEPLPLCPAYVAIVWYTTSDTFPNSFSNRSWTSLGGMPSKGVRLMWRREGHHRRCSSGLRPLRHISAAAT